jgi:type II secretory pathway pseudopilin PulG
MLNRNYHQKGFSLVEILFIAGLLVLIASAVINIGVRGQVLVDETSKSISLQNGVRAVLENMVQDVNAAIVFLNASNKKMILARYDSEINNDLFVANNANPVFPYYVEGTMTTISQPALFVEYEYFEAPGTNNLKSSIGEIAKKAKRGILQSMDSPDNSPYILDRYQPTNLVEVMERRLAEKVSFFNLNYFGYDPATGELRSIGELAGSDRLNWNAAMVSVHILAEDPYDQTGRVDPKIEIFTKMWSYKAIYDNKYDEYFGHLDKDLRF